MALLLAVWLLLPPDSALSTPLRECRRQSEVEDEVVVKSHAPLKHRPFRHPPPERKAINAAAFA